MRANFTLADHERQVSAARQRGAHTLIVSMPCCERPLELRAPTDNARWADIRMCPVCGTVWNTITTSGAVTFANPGLGVTVRREVTS